MNPRTALVFVLGFVIQGGVLGNLHICAAYPPAVRPWPEWSKAPCRSVVPARSALSARSPFTRKPMLNSALARPRPAHRCLDGLVGLAQFRAQRGSDGRAYLSAQPPRSWRDQTSLKGDCRQSSAGQWIVSAPRRCRASLAIGTRTMYGWLLRGKGFVGLWRLVGCGHVFGV